MSHVSKWNEPSGEPCCSRPAALCVHYLRVDRNLLNQLAETNTHLSLSIICLGVKNWNIDCSSSFWFGFPFLPSRNTRRSPRADLKAEDFALSPASAVDLNPTRHDPSGSTGRTILTSGEKTCAFISATLNELASERLAAREAITSLRLEPVFFGDGARPLPL
jgi:hypothetical protein